MTKTGHTLYLGIMATITVAITAFIAFFGYSYYQTPITERYYHPQYEWFKPSGLIGQGLGITGTLLILVGVILYITAKKYGYLEKIIRLRYVLEFHIFLCTLGPILVLFHTTFKFGGIVSIAFWSMTAVVLSGVAGRYIYNQIPRSISGRELSLKEIRSQQEELLEKLGQYPKLSESAKEEIASYDNPYGWGIKSYMYNHRKLGSIKKTLRDCDIPRRKRREISAIAREEIALNQRIKRLNIMQRLFKYWHIIHRPFALIMLVIVLIHIAITVALGYRWIF